MEIRSGWWTFAGIMVLVGGMLNAFDGLVAITQTRYIERNIGGQLPITNNVKTWGWVALIIGVIMLLAGFGILSGANWARGIAPKSPNESDRRSGMQRPSVSPTTTKSVVHPTRHASVGIRVPHPLRTG